MLKKMLKNKKGFTLVELMIVVLILAILLLIIVARIPQVLTRSREAKTKDHLANLRVAINNYYSTNPGIFPKSLDNTPHNIGGQDVPAFVPNYMLEIPKARLRSHPPSGANPNSNNVKVIDTQKELMTAQDIADSNIGGWIYSSTTGEIRVNCNDLDSREKIYYSNYGHEEKE
ncbi:MAG: prepilin-type N-terminal cleavage/methylation domain-containing protein [bacterium]